MSGEATILLVDETPAACAQEQAILENRGHTVTVACTTNELIEKMHRQAPQIILMSEAHTPLRGGGTLDSLKADALFGHVPVVLLLAPDAAPAQVDWTRIPVD
ncbi:MAG TPA: hypothetical protein PKI11_08765, partial [Candidatus Hydrogenedentes bacterium]|nr:hypothetical protein [Candidatus Hydrogenedentota bacterium]